LFAQPIKGKDQEIIGGTSGQRNADGSLSVSNAFVIYFDETWILNMSGPGQTKIQIPATTLSEAVDKVCKLHEEGILSNRKGYNKEDSDQ